jgi:hypothetical protein
MTTTHARRSGREIDGQVSPNGSRSRLASRKTMIEETHWTAKEWARRTRVPYRSILAATANGQLAAVRPSGTTSGCILITESSWAAWMQEIEVRRRVPGRVPPRPKPSRRQLSDLVLG